MLSFQSQSDSSIRELVSIITQICLSQEFQALKEELEQVYLEAGQSDCKSVAFQDALYAMLLQIDDPVPSIKGTL